MISGWWFQPIGKIFVKLDHFPRDRGEHKQYLKPPPRIVVGERFLLAKNNFDS